MDQQVIDLVQGSWAKVLPLADTAGRLFYSNLFEMKPEVRALFNGDMDEQARKLVQMIDVAVGKLGQPDVLVPALEQLGRRHVSYGVVPADYDVVGAALLKTLSQGLGPAFTPEVEAAWASVYGVMTQVMTKA